MRRRCSSNGISGEIYNIINIPRLYILQNFPFVHAATCKRKDTYSQKKLLDNILSRKSANMSSISYIYIDKCEIHSNRVLWFYQNWIMFSENVFLELSFSQWCNVNIFLGILKENLSNNFNHFSLFIIIYATFNYLSIHKR